MSGVVSSSERVMRFVATNLWIGLCDRVAKLLAMLPGLNAAVVMPRSW